MANTLIKITTNEPILPQKLCKKKATTTLRSYVSSKYQQLNEFFGIEETSDRAWYYGTLALMFFLPLLAVIVGGVLY